MCRKIISLEDIWTLVFYKSCWVKSKDSTGHKNIVSISIVFFLMIGLLLLFCKEYRAIPINA